jgi:hypothetical protein
MTLHDHSTLPTAEPVTPTVGAEWTPPTGPPAGPSPENPSGRKRNPKVALAGALVAVAVASAGVTAGVMAATDGSSSSSTTGGPGGGTGGFGGGLGGRGGGVGGALAALHGTYVVSDGNGSYTTELTQTGTVSAISTSSITVKSADGYSKTYTITTSTSVDNGSDKISSVAGGHTVRIVASEKGVASSIIDTNLSSGQTGNGQNGNDQNAGGSNQGGPAGGVPGQ